jgi:hypothetical protein
VTAKVRIAPVERWCQQQQDSLKIRPGSAKLAGMQIEIIPESMYLADGVKHWDLSRDSYERLVKIAEWPEIELELYSTGVVCEHMLEMD